jgi:predicted nucleotide-binding protein (sugar kinase/HSP70/actin superfamily)
MHERRYGAWKPAALRRIEGNPLAESMSIGIPRSLLYHRNRALWETFFAALGHKIVVSPATNRGTVDRGCSLAVDETCLAVKLHMGHVAWLQGRCDAVLVPRYVSNHKGEKECVKLWGIYDITRNSLPDIPLIIYNVDADGETMDPVTERRALYDLARSLGHSKADSWLAVGKAVLAQSAEERRNINAQRKVISAGRTEKPRILVSGHPYNLFDEQTGMPIIHMLEEQGAEVIVSEYVSERSAARRAKRWSPHLYWTNNLRILGAVEEYRDKVDGMVFLIAFPCGTDSLATELAIRTVKEVPVVSVILDEHTGEGGLRTRMESFVDIIRMNRKQRMAASSTGATAAGTQPGRVA